MDSGAAGKQLAGFGRKWGVNGAFSGAKEQDLSRSRRDCPFVSSPICAIMYYTNQIHWCLLVKEAFFDV
jgi:hypothetical protein